MSSAVPTDLFDGCWRRLDRAAEHRHAGVEMWNAYLEQHPYDHQLIDNGDGTYVVRVTQDTPIPAELGIRLGEWLYNLRAALDHVIWATAAHVAGTIPPPKEHVLQYPIYDNKAAWKSNLYRLNGLAEHHRDMLHRMQPCHSDPDANFLGWLNRLARDDRHRRPNSMTSYIAELHPVVALPEGTTATLQFGDRIIDAGAADCIKVIVDNWTPGMTFHINPQLGIDPEMLGWSRSPFWQRWAFAKRLVVFESFVKGEVVAYEYDCTGQSRRDDMLMDTFKAECDARGPRATPAPAPRPATTWTEPKTGTPASDATMARAGYPDTRA